MDLLRFDSSGQGCGLALLVQHKSEIGHLNEGALRPERSTADAGLEYPIGVASDGNETVCRAAKRLIDIGRHGGRWAPFCRDCLGLEGRSEDELKETCVEGVLILNRNLQQLELGMLRIYDDIPCLGNKYARDL